MLGQRKFGVFYHMTISATQKHGKNPLKSSPEARPVCMTLKHVCSNGVRGPSYFQMVTVG